MHAIPLRSFLFFATQHPNVPCTLTGLAKGAAFLVEIFCCAFFVAGIQGIVGGIIHNQPGIIGIP